MELLPILLAVLAGHVAPPSCSDVPGSEKLLSSQAMQWLVVGEVHGTVETPVAFTDIVCLAAKTKRLVTVALEFPDDQQSYLDDFMASDGGAAARAKLLEAPFWHGQMRDGRSSRATAEMLDRLRALKRAKLVNKTIAFQPSRMGNPVEYEKLMADTVKKAASDPNDLVVVQVGNIHARLNSFTSRDKSYMPMAGWLPREKTVSLLVIDNGGETWGCFSNVCGPKALNHNSAPSARGVELPPDDGGPYSGAFYLGSTVTASPPAIDAPER